MTFSVLGFSQRRLVELGLSMDEAMVLRWFVDYLSSGKMRVIQFGGHTWYWVNFSGVLESLPIIGGSAKTVSRRFEKLEAAGVLEHYTFREGGVFSCYRINAVVYESLIDDIQQQKKAMLAKVDTETPELFATDITPSEPVEECWTNEQGGETELSNGETELSNRWTDLSEQKNSLSDQSIKLTKKPPVSPNRGKRSRFVKPSVDEIRAYCESRNNGIDAQQFYDANEATGWVVGRTCKPMKDWQATIRVWEATRKRGKPVDRKRVNDGFEDQIAGRVRL